MPLWGGIQPHRSRGQYPNGLSCLSSAGRRGPSRCPLSGCNFRPVFRIIPDPNIPARAASNSGASPFAAVCP